MRKNYVNYYLLKITFPNLDYQLHATIHFHKITASTQMLSHNRTVDRSRLLPKERFYQNY